VNREPETVGNQYLFILGRETELCFAELETVMGSIDATATIQNLPTGVALVQHAPSGAQQDEAGSSDLDPAWWQNRLGGTRLVARVLATVPSVSADAIHALLAPEVREVALSSPSVSVGERRKLLQGLKRLRPNLRYRENHDAYLASGLSERLIRRTDGAEIVLIEGSDGWHIAQVVAVQDTAAWTERDRGLPAPEAVVGMLPPKVARIMVNLAEPARHRVDPSPVAGHPVLLDPFCGSGQIPIEGLRLGWNVTASDLDAQGIERTKTNLTWAQERSADAAKQEWASFRSDIANLTQRLMNQRFDAMVTEPDLGPPLMSSTAVPSEKVLDGVAATISLAFDAGRTLLRSSGRLVIVIPIIAGHRIVERLDDSVRDGYALRATLKYARPDARVERELFVFDRT
jgi:tRNA G10  N-methylase Trm11